jgi:hypothetical protein
LANELIRVPGISVFAATEWYLIYVGQNNRFPTTNKRPALSAATLDSEELISCLSTSGCSSKLWKFLDKPANAYGGGGEGGAVVCQSQVLGKNQD